MRRASDCSGTMPLLGCRCARLPRSSRAEMRLAALLLALSCLAGCGVKGPLYIPTPQQEREMAERDKRLEERRQREKAQQAQQQQQGLQPPKGQTPQAAPQDQPTQQ